MNETTVLLLSLLLGLIAAGGVALLWWAGRRPSTPKEQLRPLEDLSEMEYPPFTSAVEDGSDVCDKDNMRVGLRFQAPIAPGAYGGNWEVEYVNAERGVATARAAIIEGVKAKKCRHLYLRGDKWYYDEIFTDKNTPYDPTWTL